VALAALGCKRKKEGGEDGRKPEKMKKL